MKNEEPSAWTILVILLTYINVFAIGLWLGSHL